MPTVEDLGRETKAKFPKGYFGNTDDISLGRAMKAHNPGLYDHYVDVKKTVLIQTTPIFDVYTGQWIQPTFTSKAEAERHMEQISPGAYNVVEVSTQVTSRPQAESHLAKISHGAYTSVEELTKVSPRTQTDPEPELSPLEKNVKAITEYYRPDRGRFTSWWQRGKSEGRSKLLRALNEEQAEVIRQAAMLEQAVMEGRRREEEFNMFLARNAAELFEIHAREQLIEAALLKGRTVDTDQQVKLAESLSEIKVDENKLLSSIAVEEHKLRGEIDLEHRWQEITQDLDAGDLLELAEQQLIQKQTKYLEELYLSRYQIATGNLPPEVKEPLLARYDKNIRHLEAKIDARQTGLLLSQDREEAKRIGEGSPEGGRYYEFEAESNSEQVPPKRPRGRPRKNLPE